MAQLYFIWKGEKSDTKGITVVEYPPIIHPKERGQQIVIPGRNGDVTLLEGESGTVFDPYTRTVDCYALAGQNDAEIAAWLRGTGELVIGDRPDRVYKAAVSENFEISRALHGKYREFSIPFYIQPLGGKYPPETNITVTSSGRSIYNPGDVPSMPKVTVNGSGAVSLTIGGTAVGLSLTTGTIVLDWESGVVTNAAGTQSLAAFVTGGPQRIPVGSSAVSWRSVNNGSVSSVVIEPRWRWF